MKYFTINELSKSTTAANKGIKNIPNDVETYCLTLLVDKVLDPIRKAWGRPIVVNSGFRCDRLNKLIGGASNSDHKYGRAADIEDYSRDTKKNKELFELIRKLNIPYKQLINEYNYDWIHIAYDEHNLKQETIQATKVGTKTVYTIMK